VEVKETHWALSGKTSGDLCRCLTPLFFSLSALRVHMETEDLSGIQLYPVEMVMLEDTLK
jgi:hypothetical protein